ncbi:hypothetical protein [Tenacibaculum amylolyticum]|uniref:hypothetical protein n=1 Tax=Tenacibaculum amylolyticum TaxID=104269 RepID=UPI003893C1EF
MKTAILNLGKSLNKKEQKTINGGTNCQICYANNAGLYNPSDPYCDGCPLPVPHE